MKTYKRLNLVCNDVDMLKVIGMMEVQIKSLIGMPPDTLKVHVASCDQVGCNLNWHPLHAAIKEIGNDFVVLQIGHTFDYTTRLYEGNKTVVTTLCE